MNEKMTAYCGIVCSDCPSLTATRANDVEALKQVAEMARKEWGVADATWETVQCTGCKGGGVRIAYCAECNVRACASEKGVETCAHCPQYLTCEIIQALQKQIPETKDSLDAIYAALN